MRREQLGDITRLYTVEGYVDVPTEQIASFEVDDTPLIQPKQTPQGEQVLQPQQTPANQPEVAAIENKKIDLDQLIREASARRQLDPDFVNSVIKAESNFKIRAVSPKGAQGLMQLMPGTAAQLGVNDPFDPRANVEAGTTYLSNLLDLYHDDAVKALAAYNAGTQRVDQYHGVPPYRETRTYIARIVRDFNAKKRAQMTPAQQAAANKARANNATHKTATAGKNARKKKVQQASAGLPQPTGSAPVSTRNF
jgi:soluble lytic murein transglycosylase-like protein